MKKSIPAPQVEIQSKKIMSRKNLFIGLGVVLFLLVLGSSIYFFTQYQASQNLLKSTKGGNLEVEGVVTSVGKLMELPKGEVPTLATVSDKSKLKDQAFFKRAENGDKVLIFANAKRAILYRPSLNKIIDVTSIDLSEPVASPQASLKPDVVVSVSSGVVPSVSPVRVVIYNGTKVTGLAGRGKAQLSELPAYSVISIGNSKGDFAESLVVDLTGKNKDKVSELARVFSAKSGTLPKGETKPNPSNSSGQVADILVILGASYAE